jgi:outer membrane receptor protein involved in Fe transport
LRNTGLLLNYTYVTSKIQYAVGNSFGTAVTDDLVGLSRNAFNATFYYEDPKLSARISGAYRDSYLQAVPSGGPESDVQGVDPNLFIDASASYRLTQRLRLTFEALNITDEFNRYFIDSTRDDTLFYSHSGRTFSLGVSFKY